MTERGLAVDTGNGGMYEVVSFVEGRPPFGRLSLTVAGHGQGHGTCGTALRDR